MCQTDGQTDRQTDVQPISITCFSIADARKKRAEPLPTVLDHMPGRPRPRDCFADQLRSDVSVFFACHAPRQHRLGQMSCNVHHTFIILRKIEVVGLLNMTALSVKPIVRFMQIKRVKMMQNLF